MNITFTSSGASHITLVCLRYHVKRELPKHKNYERTNGVITHYVLKF